MFRVEEISEVVVVVVEHIVVVVIPIICPFSFVHCVVCYSYIHGF
jgi:hypothetical protein